MAAIAASVSALLFVDMAHIAGLVAAGVIPSPVPHADVVTFTCYKTMAGARGGVILCRDGLAKKIDHRVFPGCQGTSAVDLIAAKAVTFHLAAGAAFKSLQQRTLENARVLAEKLAESGFRVITGGTDTHQVLVDVTVRGLNGARAETVLESTGLVTNRNTIPADREHPGTVSGIRLGTGAVSARGMGPDEMVRIAQWIDTVLSVPEDKALREPTRVAVGELCRRYPIPA
jgi:glycine hydroxymethyltransferase